MIVPMFSTYVFKHFFKSYHNIITIHEKITSQLENIIIVETKLLASLLQWHFIQLKCYSCNVGVFWEDVDLDLDYGFSTNLSQNVLTLFH
jgi:hypothetical protein